MGYNLQMTVEIETNKDFWQRDPDKLWVHYSPYSFGAIFLLKISLESVNYFKQRAVFLVNSLVKILFGILGYNNLQQYGISKSGISALY